MSGAHAAKSLRIVSVLYREPMWLKRSTSRTNATGSSVSVLYREPMWLKPEKVHNALVANESFSALP